MEQTTLNLARKWRSQVFDTLVGQDLAVKILKNSLYVGHYFPVYLFAGQRGCGKTSTARIFAAALNCVVLDSFKIKPKDTVIPCGACDSCKAMQQLHHPDFIEMDAASHTGVDNMRTVIDAAYYLPVLGRKKIYLIDEAHMLSKAAFNAVLKLFEEPPTHAHFILATTDPEKIIDTVRSRCFTLFFDAVDGEVLAHHLAAVCIEEKIVYEFDALLYIARCAEGSVRDALNILETIRFSHTTITKDGVIQALGHVDDQQLALYIRAIAAGDGTAVLALWNREGTHRASAQHVWTALVRLLRGMIWTHYKVTPPDLDSHVKKLLSDVPLSVYLALLQELYTLEPLFIRTNDQQGLLEFSLLQLASRFKKNDSGGSPDGQSSAALTTQSIEVNTDDSAHSDDEVDGDDDIVEDDEDVAVKNPEQLFVVCKKELIALADSLLASIFAHLVSIELNDASNAIILHFTQNYVFFADTLMQAKTVWQSIVQKQYASMHEVQILFDVEILPMQQQVKQKAVAEKKEIKKVVPATYAQNPQSAYQQRRSNIVQEQRIDVSDAQRWPLVNRVLRYFPGTVTLVDEARV